MTAAVSTLCLASIAASDGHQTLRAAGAATPSAMPGAAAAGPRVSARKPCSAHRAVKFYAARIREHAAKMGVAASLSATGPRGSRCPRYLAAVLQRKAYAWRLRYERWWARTPKLSGETWRDVRLDSAVNRNLWRLAVCETGGINGGVPLWSHHNSVYSGALGFAHSTWSHWRHFVRPLPPPVAAHASPAEQLAVGRALVRTFGGYSSWPACHRRLGLG